MAQTPRGGFYEPPCKGHFEVMEPQVRGCPGQNFIMPGPDRTNGGFTGEMETEGCHVTDISRGISGSLGFFQLSLPPR